MAWNKGRGAAYAWIVAHSTYDGDDCLPWPFSAGDGYGCLGYLGKDYRANRLMCEMVNGPPPTPNHQADHSCGNGLLPCVTPRHLSWKTNGDNQLDRRKHGTKNIIGPGRLGKIMPEQDAQIRALAEHKTQMELAAMFGVSRSTIQYRLYGGSYKPRRRRLTETA